MRASSLIPAIALSSLLAAPPARAQDSGAALFQKGLALYGRGETAAACRAFEQSYRVEPATGTLFNLGKCHAKEGHYWEARAEFRKLAGEMDAAGKAAKAQLARDQASAAEAHVPKVEFAFPPSSNVDRISIDGRDVDAAKWKSPIPVAPGSHRVLFRAQGELEQGRTVEAQGDGATVGVHVPVLSPQATPARKPSRAPRDRGTATASGWAGQRVAGAVVAGAGVVALGVGAVFGVRALGQKSDADRACGSSSGTCTSAANAKIASHDIHVAQTTASVSTITIGGGLLTAAIGGYLFFTGGRKTQASAGVRVVPTFARTGGGLTIGGRF